MNENRIWDSDAKIMRWDGGRGRERQSNHTADREGAFLVSSLLTITRI